MPAANPTTRDRAGHWMPAAAVWLALCLLPVAGSPAEKTSGDERSVRAAASASPRGLLNRLFPGIRGAQRKLDRTLSRELDAFRATGSPTALLTAGLVAFAYGVVHGAGPGHGKIVVSSFFVGRRARFATGVAVGVVVSLLQVLSAIAAVLVLALALDHT